MASRPAYPGQKPRRGRRLVKGVVGLLVTALLLGGAFVLVDMGLRDFAETRAEREIKSSLPAGATTPEVTIGGFSFLQQAFSGSVDEVDVDFGLTGQSLTVLARSAGFAGTISVDTSVVQLSSELEVLGVAVPYTVSLKPTLDGDYLVLVATAISAAGSAEVDLSQFIDLASAGVRFCAASLLPETMRLTSITASADLLAVTALGEDMPVDLKALSRRGTCEVPDGKDAEEGANPAVPAA